MRITDIYFFGVMFIGLIVVFMQLLFGCKLPELFNFWWFILLPGALLKVFFKKSKITKWMEKERF